MIVNLAQEGWEVIYHRAHALLAAQIAGHWRKSNAPERFYETIAAISHHDDLEKEWEGDELTEAGAPLDFTLGRGDSTEPLRQHLADARYRGRWVALLTSKHITYLSQDKWGSSKEWEDFLNEQVQNQEQWSKELGVEKGEVERAYQFMLWCDRLSLILTQKQLPDDQRSLEITSGIEDQRYDIRQLSNGNLTVEPWPFEDEFIVNVEASCLSELKFENNDALVRALQSAPIKVLTWTFSEKQ